MVIRRTNARIDKFRIDLAVRSETGAVFGCVIDHEDHMLICERGLASIESPNKPDAELGREILEALGDRCHATYVRVIHIDDAIDGFRFNVALGLAASTNNFTDGAFREMGTSKGRSLIRCVGGTYLVRASRHERREIYTLDVLLADGFDRAALAQTLMDLV